MDEISKRNFLAVQDAITELHNKNSDLVFSITNLQNAVTMLQIQIQKNTQDLAVLTAMSRGHGPTG
jgi:hypothetical protein